MKIQAVIIASIVLSLVAGKGEAAVGGLTIGGCMYTGEGTVTYTPVGPEVVADWATVYTGAAPVVNGQVMVQNQHSGGAIVTYGVMGLGPAGNCWEATLPDTLTPGSPDVTDLVVMFSAPGHDSTSREFTWDANLSEFIHPQQGGGVVGVTAETIGPQDAYLPPLDGNNELPTANLLHFVFYDEFTNGAPDGVDLQFQGMGLNGVQVQVIDLEGNVVATGITGAAPFTTADGLLYDSNTPGGIPNEGTVYFTGLPGGKEYKIISNPATVTQEANPNLDLKMVHTAPESCTTDTYGYNNPGCNWYQTYTEEGGHAWEAYLRPGDPGTEGGGYLTWHGFIEKIGNDAGGNPAIAGTISGIIIDADGNDPQEPFVQLVDGRIPPTNARFEDGTPWDVNANSAGWGQPGLPNLTADVIPNGRVPDTILALYTMGTDIPALVATTQGSGIANYNDPAGAEFNFVNVPPGQYEIFVFDRDLVNVPNVGTAVNVLPQMNSQAAIMLPRFAGRGIGFVENNGAFPSGKDVKLFYKSGAVKQVETTNGNGYFQFDAMPETGSAGVAYVDLQDGDTIRGKIITEDFQKFQGPTSIATSVTHNGMSRVIQWWTLNYFIDLQVEDIPVEVGNLIGVVYNDGLAMGSWQGNGIWDDAKEKTFQGVQVNLVDAAGTVVATSSTGVLDKADVALQGWHVPYTWPLNEIGGVFAGPVVCNTCTQTTGDPGPAVGFYEFRDIPPGSYRVEVVPPNGMTEMYGQFFTSLNGNGIDVLGITGTVRNEDILFFDGVQFHMFFDGSLAGLPGSADIDGLHVVDHDTFYVSFIGPNSTGRTVAVPAGVTSGPFVADDEDVILYDAGNWSMYFDGSLYGLGDMNGEDIDGLALLPDGRMIISTRGGANSTNVANVTPLAISSTTGWTGTNPRPQDEDLLVFDGMGFDLYLDGSDVGVGLNGGNDEDVWGVSVSSSGEVYLTTNRSFTADPISPAPSLTGGGNDVFACRTPILGGQSGCTTVEFLFDDDGITYGLANTSAETLDAVSLFGLGLRDDIVVSGGLNSRVDLAVTAMDVASGRTFGVPLAGEIEGGMFSGNGDLDPNPTSLLFDEATAMVGSPVAVYDHFNYLLGVMYQGDPYCNSGNNAIYTPGTYPTNPFACRLAGANPSEKPESERRFAPGIHRYSGNDPNFTKNPMDPAADKANGFDTNFDTMELGFGMEQAGYKMEAAWTPLSPITGGPTEDICAVDLAGISFPAEDPMWGATVTITVEDIIGIPVAGAEVFGTWNVAGEMTCITDNAGQCAITLEKVEGEPLPTSVDFTLTNVDAGLIWYLYNPAGAGCVTGITITNQ